MWTDILLVILGALAGFGVSAAVFALITSIGIVPRLADKTHTGKYVRLYECAILLGGGLGNAFFIYAPVFSLPVFVIGIAGLFFGIYVGCLATALAEALNVTAVFSRRLKLHKGLGIVILFFALGKCVGSLAYFFMDFFTTIE
ncbi:MAG: stage V sporulation protein AB [Lachnospiraceae bacterium]|nr:stage V sporulation protein AB [Lachnospiraceae bacterium]MDE6698728.1 stage V sporulation protein AB [Lachnospiraceae bacterium]